MFSNETIKQVANFPLSFIITLPDGSCPGRFESAEDFVASFSDLKVKFPNKHFQILPFSYSTPKDGTDPALNAILAIELIIMEK